MYTSHGYHIPGTDERVKDVLTEELRLTCNGPQKCDSCDQEIWEATSIMTGENAKMNQDTARFLVFKYIKQRHTKQGITDDTFTIDDVLLVWFTYVLGNWKALVTTKLPDDMYYEVTHNITLRETYIDAYEKIENVCVGNKSN